MRDLAAELRGTAARERRHGRNDVPQLCEDAASQLRRRDESQRARPDPALGSGQAENVTR